MSMLAFFSRDGLAAWIKSATFALPKSANIGKNKEWHGRSQVQALAGPQW